MNTTSVSRRSFLATTGAAVAATGLASGVAAPNAAVASAPGFLKGRLYKTLKIGMVGVKGDLTTKFQAARDAGFDGIEMNAPGMDVDETRKAIEATGDFQLTGQSTRHTGRFGILIQMPAYERKRWSHCKMQCG